MSRTRRELGFDWLAVLIVLTMVLVIGARLIYLGSQRDAAVARQRAAESASQLVAKIEPRLRGLAALAVSGAAKGSLPATVATAPSARHPAVNVFLMTADHQVLASPPNATAAAAGIASEWAAVESARPVADSATLGPVRVGSQWLLAMRSPVIAGSLAETGPPRGWAVSFADVDQLVADARLSRLTGLGYDFELIQIDPRSPQPRVFIGSRSEPLADPVAAHIRLPAGQSAAMPGSSLEIALRPRTGWIPPPMLVAEIGLLVFMAWLLAFGTHDLVHAVQRSRRVVTTARKRMRAVNQQLATEMQRRVSLQETFDYSRFHDAFTGLPNRRYFMDHLDRGLRDLRMRRRERIAVVLIDIARFKLINDMLGHTAGDELMVRAARRFEKTVSSSETVLARWSGDQFALLLLDAASRERALELATSLQEELRMPLELHRQRVAVSAAVGLTTVDSGQQRAEDVVREADIALSFAKRQETEKIATYNPAMAAQTASLVSLEADLHVALEKRELRLLFQPIVNLHTYRMVGAEALLRWRHPVERVLTPDRFLQIAEDAGLMLPIARWTILRVAKLLAEWRSRLPPDEGVFISINLSATVLRDKGLADFVAAVLRDVQVPPEALKFELTEAAIISNVGAARETLDRLHNLGIQLMLDDFGTGYSSLSYLQLFPFDYVKIERPFVNRNQSDQANTGMMAALVQMASSLKLTPIAELVETEAAARTLEEMGCDFGQGYYFSEPLEAAMALQRLQSRRPFQPQRDSSPTVETAPLDLDDSPTIRIPADSIRFSRSE